MNSTVRLDKVFFSYLYYIINYENNIFLAVNAGATGENKFCEDIQTHRGDKNIEMYGAINILPPKGYMH